MGIRQIKRDGWHIGGQPFFGPPALIGPFSRSEAADEAISGTHVTRADLAPQTPAGRG
jgi:4-oxalocrotonate tautomerase